jgi:hypothetical protein
MTVLITFYYYELYIVYSFKKKVNQSDPNNYL